MIYIPHNVPSSKNSKQWTGKMLISSKLVRNYKDKTADSWMFYKSLFRSKIFEIEKPYKVSFLFVRDSKRKFDYINPLQTVQDLMVEYGWIDDDNADEIIPVILPYQYKKNDGGVYIDIIK